MSQSTHDYVAVDPESPDEPFEPTDADWAEFEEWCESQRSGLAFVDDPVGVTILLVTRCPQCGGETFAFGGERLCPDCTTFSPAA
jgi:hypothetical protein